MPSNIMPNSKRSIQDCKRFVKSTETIVKAGGKVVPVLGRSLLSPVTLSTPNISIHNYPHLSNKLLTTQIIWKKQHSAGKENHFVKGCIIHYFCSVSWGSQHSSSHPIAFVIVENVSFPSVVGIVCQMPVNSICLLI